MVEARAWAADHGIAVTGPEDCRGEDIAANPCIDFGRLERRTPRFVLRTTSAEQVAASLAYLAGRRLPYKLRGAAHSPGGEVLSEGGAVVDLGGLSGIVAEGDDEITALGGTTWLALWERLAPTGRRPLGLTTNPRVTVAGLLSVGGVPDTAHLHGAMVAGVRRLVLATPRGELRPVAPGDPLFDHALCGHGQVGAIVEATVATWPRSHVLTGRVLRWDRPDQFLADAEIVLERRLYDYFRGRLEWRWPAPRVWALAGQLVKEAPLDDPGLAQLRPRQVSPVERFDLLAHAVANPVAHLRYFAPCVELVYPYPDGIDAFRRADAFVVQSRLNEHLPRGASLMLLPGTRGLPLSPFQSPRCLVLVIRPEIHRIEDARTCDARLERLAEDALAAGGRVYLTSFPLSRVALERQLGPAAATLATLRRELDPDGLCCRGNLFGWGA